MSRQLPDKNERQPRPRLTTVSRLTIVVLAVLLGSSVGSADSVTPRWNGVTSTTFTQVFVRAECPGQSTCLADDFGILEDSWAECWDFDNPTLDHCFASAWSDIGWTIDGRAGYFPTAGDTDWPTIVYASGQRVSPDLFTVNGNVITLDYNMSPQEVAVIRFEGDPMVFDGVEATGVADLVSLGLIETNDVLAVVTLDVYGNFQLDADVTGIPDDEILIFVAGDGPVPEITPAFTGLASDSFSYCYAHSKSFYDAGHVFPGIDRCDDSDLNLTGNCSAHCPTLGADSDVAGLVQWTVNGSTKWVSSQGIVYSGGIEAHGMWIPPGSFALTGTQNQTHPAVNNRLAVFRYAGDPAAFDGLTPWSVEALVEMGLIAESDVLFAHDFGPSDAPTLQGVRLASARALYGYDVPIVPATSFTGALVLLLTMVGIGMWALKK
jgi:hypothetical protein